MHLLYLDDAGSASNQSETHFVLGGISIFEAQASFVTQRLDELAAQIYPQDPHAVEFHASEIFSGRKTPWKQMPNKDQRRDVIKKVLQVTQDCYDTARVFACAVHKPSFPNADPVELAFEDLCSRFDLYLRRLYARGDTQRGLIILDKSAYETSLQRMATEFRSLGTRWGVIRNLADTPLFVDSRASRVVQLADHIAYAVFRRYNAGDISYFDIVSSRFDEEDGKLHGLTHRQTFDLACMCPACMSRRLTQTRPDRDPPTGRV